MAALSSFGWQMQADREDLCSRLVCNLLPVQVQASSHCAMCSFLAVHVTTAAALQAGDGNHDLAMEYCLQNLERHRFGDVDPKSVESLYAG